MKTYKFFALAAAATMLTACSSEEPAVVTQSGNNYIKVQICTDKATRAETYANGEGMESTIKNIVFGFYDVAGNKVGTPTVINNPTFTTQTDGSNVEQVYINQVQTELEAGTKGQLLVLINATAEAMPNNISGMATDETALAQAVQEDCLRMSNSTYVDAEDNVKCAVDITENMVVKQEDLATADPINVYVERQAARISVTNGITGDEAYNHAKYIANADKTLEFEITNWITSSTPSNTYTFKQGIATDLTKYGKGDYRTFWAETLKANLGKDEYASENMYKSWTDANVEVGKKEYVLEHYATVELGENDANRYNSFALVVGQYKLGGEAKDFYLYGYAEKNGEVYPVVYETEEALKNAVISACNVTKEDGTPATADDLKIVNKEGSISYVTFEAAEGVTLATELKATAKYYNKGAAYYYVPIEHKAATETEAAVYGVIRNHAYTVNITGIEGLAAPVNDPDEPIIPDDPETVYAIKATINILAWRIVPTQNTTLK